MTKAFAAHKEKEDLKEFELQRRDVLENDVHVDIEYCGICHSDIHTVQGDWGPQTYPCVPGHEIVGRVREVGANVTKFKKGDLVGVGCLVDSCRECSSCKEDLEQFCETGATFTYGSKDKHTDGVTYGGYSQDIVVDQKFVLSVSEELDTKAVAPLLCAGITTYSPLNRANIKPGDKVGIIGLGGLGHMGVKIAAAMGANVTMITTSEKKGEDAKLLGAHDVLISKDSEAMAKQNNSFDFLLSTIPVKHDLTPYLALLKREASLVMVGATQTEFNSFGVIMGRKNISGSLIGGLKETQEMLDFCAKHNIVSEVEMINIQDVNEAYKRVIDADVKYRFVIDMKSLQ